MLKGGIYDQIGGGFARYSVDAVWLVPHFEKMLYDNALLARVYLHAWQRLGEERWMRVCRETLDWVLRDMRGPEGGFYSALDADSEGEEGRFYVWEEDEMREALAEGGVADEEVERLLGYWGVSPAGNFEGRNILHVPAGAAAKPPPNLDDAKRALLARREQRVPPGLDDKRIMLLERPDDRRPRRCRRRLGPRGLPGRRRAAAHASSSRSSVTPTAACCARGRTAGDA